MQEKMYEIFPGSGAEEKKRKTRIKHCTEEEEMTFVIGIRSDTW